MKHEEFLINCFILIWYTRSESFRFLKTNNKKRKKKKGKEGVENKFRYNKTKNVFFSVTWEAL